MKRKPVNRMTNAEVLAELQGQIGILNRLIAMFEPIAQACETRGKGRGFGPLLARMRARALRRRLARWTAMLETVVSVHEELRRCL